MVIKTNLTSNKVGNIFFEWEDIYFRINSEDLILKEPIKIEVKDWSKNKKIIKEIEIKKAGTLNLGKLEKGYYSLSYKKEKINFGVVVNPNKRKFANNSPFCLDVGACWFFENEKSLKDAISIIKSLGVSCIRDRFSWREIEKMKGEFDFGWYKKCMEIQLKEGLELHQTFHDSPEWASGKKEETYPPKNPIDMGKFLGRMASEMKGVSSWEIWNEPDCQDPYFFTGTPREYFSLLKTSYKSIKGKNSKAKILLCSFSKSPEEFAKKLFEESIKNYFDVYNFHFYTKRDPIEVIDRIKEHKKFLKNHKIDKPLWITEIGFKRRKVEKSKKALLKEASNLVKLYLYSISEGVEKVFWFILADWSGKKYNYGLMKKDFTPKPTYIALSNLTYQLGRGKYLNQDYIKDKDIKTFIFDTGEKKIMVAWSDEKKEIILNKSNFKNKIFDLFGKDLTPLSEDKNSIKVETDSNPRYIEMH